MGLAQESDRHAPGALKTASCIQHQVFLPSEITEHSQKSFLTR